MAQQSARRGRKNQGFPLCREHAVGDVVPVRELPYGPAASDAASQGRTDGSIRLRALPPKIACVFWGVHRWEADLPLSVIPAFAGMTMIEMAASGR